MYALSDEALCAQRLCHKLPLPFDRSSPTRWCQRFHQIKDARRA
jgi:hypothetical protein